MREEFEKLKHIQEKLDGLIYNVRDSLYEAKSFTNLEQVADMHWVNGAWYAFQEQQKTIVKYEAGLRKNKANKHKLLAKNIELQKKIDSMLDHVCGSFKDFK